MSRAAWTLQRRPFIFARLAAELSDPSSNPWAISCNSQAVLETFCEKIFTHRPADRDRSDTHFLGNAFCREHISQSIARSFSLPQGQK
jgi:hypothetical protein